MRKCPHSTKTQEVLYSYFGSHCWTHPLVLRMNLNKNALQWTSACTNGFVVNSTNSYEISAVLHASLMPFLLLMGRATMISSWLLATNFVSSLEVFMKEWPRRSRVILTSPSVFVLSVFVASREKPSVLLTSPCHLLWSQFEEKLHNVIGRLLTIETTLCPCWKSITYTSKRVPTLC